jgi:hypothetical protein
MYKNYVRKYSLMIDSCNIDNSCFMHHLFLDVFLLEFSARSTFMTLR